MHTQVLRINYNHCKPQLLQEYLPYKQALERCVVATLSAIDRVVMPLPNLWFEDRGLQQNWEQCMHYRSHEQMLGAMGLHHQRHHLEELHEQLEVFLQRRYSQKANAVYVSMNLDAMYHLCIQFRTF